MAKRFTATDKWQDPWFCGLSERDRLFWMYLLDNCDHAGIWKVNRPLVEFYFPGYSLNISIFNNRVHEISKDKWFIPKFVKFQYPKGLKKEWSVTASVISILENHGLLKAFGEQLGYCYQTVQDKDKDKDKDKEKEKDKSKDITGGSDFVVFQDGEREKLEEKYGNNIVNKYINKLDNYIGSTGKQYKSHYHTLINWITKDIDTGRIQIKSANLRKMEELYEKSKQKSRDRYKSKD